MYKYVYEHAGIYSGNYEFPKYRNNYFNVKNITINSQRNLLSFEISKITFVLTKMSQLNVFSGIFRRIFLLKWLLLVN